MAALSWDDPPTPRVRYLGSMEADAPADNEQEVLCPHCKKVFSATLLSGRRSRGFKCPHCRLFVPLERAADSPVRPDAA
jgi:hypothetical protein